MKPKPLNRVLKPKPLRQSYGYDVLRTFALSSTFVRIDEVLSAVEGLKLSNAKLIDDFNNHKISLGNLIRGLEQNVLKWFPVAKKGAE